MPLSTLLHLECDPVEPVDAMKHVVFSCPQSQGANLEQLLTIVSQRFAVMYDDEMGDHLIEMLDRAHSAGALAPVKLIAVQEHGLYVLLDATVASVTLPAIARLWESVVVADIERPLSVSFALETEVGTGQSDFESWDDAKDILESYSLGIGPLNPPAHDRADLSIHAFEQWAQPDVDSENQIALAARYLGSQASYLDKNQDRLSPGRIQARIDQSCSDRPSLLSNSEVMALEKATYSCSSLRDTCMRAMFMLNARTVELTSIKVEDVIISETAVKVRINAFKSRRSMHRFLAPAITSDVLCRYVQEYHLSPEDYLFPSAINASKPLSIREVRVAFDRWLRDAQIEREQLIPSGVRSTFTRLNQSITPQSIAEMTGHGSLPKTLDYIALLYLPHDK